MAFDIEGARAAGYSDAEIADHLAQQSRFDAGQARKAGYSDAEIVQHLAGQQPKPQKAGAGGDEPGRFASLAAGGGAGFGRVVLNVQKLVGKGATALGVDRAGQWLQDDAEAGLRKIEGEVAPYKEAHPVFAGAGELAGEVVATAPVGGVIAGAAAKVPGVAAAAPNLLQAVRTGGMSAGGGGVLTRTAGGAITGGAAAGLVSPEDATTGAAVGAALPVVGAAVKGVARAVRLNPNNPQLAAKAINQYGIPLGVADVSNNPVVRATRSVLNDTPIVGSIGQRQHEAVQQGFNRAVGATFGAPAPKLTPEVLDVAKKRMGAEFDRIWDGNALRFDGELAQSLQELRASAAKLPQGESARLTGWLDDVESKMVATQGGGMVMPGDVANRLQSKLRQEVERASGFLKDDLRTLRRSIVGAFNRSVSPDDAATLARTMGQYKAFKTVQPLLQGAEAGVAGRQVGDVPAALLPQAVRQSYSANIAGSPLADLTQIGSQYVADRVARTGGSTRAAVQNGALGALALTSPLKAALALPVAAGVQKGLGSTVLARRMVATPQPGMVPLSSLLDPAAAVAYRTAPLLAANPR